VGVAHGANNGEAIPCVRHVKIREQYVEGLRRDPTQSLTYG
jgi:hypothetical protein